MNETPSNAGQSATPLYDFVLASCDDIVELWLQRARGLFSLRESSHALTDRATIILRQIAVGTRARLLGEPLAEVGSLQTEGLGQGHNLTIVMNDYALLRQCILELWEREVGANIRVAELRGFDEEVQAHISGAAARFIRERDRRLSALDEIAESAFGPSDVDACLERLLQTVLDATDVADMAEIYLRDGDLLKPIVRRGFGDARPPTALQMGEGLVGKIAAQRRPLAANRASEQGLVETGSADGREIIQFGVPMIAGDDLIGVAVMASRTASRFSEDDELLFATMISRVNLVVQSMQLRKRVSLHADRNEAILNAALDCVISMSDSGEIISWNRAAERTFGYSRQEAVGADMAELIIPPALRVAHRSGVKHYLTTGEQRYFDRRLEFNGMRSDGSEFPVELTITRLPGEHPLFTGFLRDISKEKQAEQERQQLMEEVTRAAGTQRFLSDSSKRLTESLDYETTLATIPKLVVPAIADFCAVDMLEGGQLRRISVAHTDPETAAFASDILRRSPLDSDAPHGAPAVVRSGKTQLSSAITDALLVEIARDPEHLRLLRALGLRSYISTPVTVRGALLGVITVLSAESGRRYDEADVLVLEELALRVATAVENARLYREAQSAVRARENVLAVVSHDLRNPLNAIALSASALSMMHARSAPESKEKQQVDRIRRAVDRMSLLIDDLLDTASMQANRLSIDCQSIPLRPLLDEVYEAHMLAASEAGIALERQFGQLDVEVRCDRNRLIQALSNLLGNAIKFCRAGDRIELSAQQQGEEVVLSIADTGPGIAAEDLEHIFDPYWTVPDQGGSGTGLGLYIVRGIVEAHGGRAWVESEVDSGTRFFLTIPMS